VDTTVARWEQDGFFLVPGFCSPRVCERMLDRAVALAREANGAGVAAGSLVMPEANLADATARSATAESRVSKIFKLHRDSVFHDFAIDGDLLSLIRPLLGGEFDCFLSQFIFKNPAAWGQPWHQDSYYFPFDRGPQIGIWLAITEASLENGCLRVVPGSQREPVHEHVRDRRPGANLGYVEIVDYDMRGAAAVRMKPGDLLVFHSHLMHRSEDNVSNGMRAAMVYHYAKRGSVDRSVPPSPIHDWMPVGQRGAS
jgi:ectoine hydroxylase-related dioxygenase (phytanoyl-CoA dioxygenase family)